MITQCSIRHLYALDPVEFPSKDRLIDIAKRFERRKCGHHELEEPLSEKECFDSVMLKNGQNKHRYVIATQDKEIRSQFKTVPGVPSIVINRSVMILEAMNKVTKHKRDGMEREKFSKGIVDARAAEKVLKKRKREDEEDAAEGAEGAVEGEAKEKKKKKKRGEKGPNPLSVMKKKPVDAAKPPKKKAAVAAEGDADTTVKKKRIRKHGKSGAAPVDAAAPVPAAVPAAVSAPAPAASED